MEKKTDPVVIVPNLKFRLSGVTSTIIALLPKQETLIKIVATGPGLPQEISKVKLWKIPFFSRKISRVWHARRNTEMLVGIILKYVLKCNLRLLFTSASQRHHTKFTKFLINRMDRVIATSKAGQKYLEVPSTVLMHGIDTDVFCPERDKSQLRKSLGLPDEILVGCIGRIRPSKGTDIFLDAAIHALSLNCNGRFLIIGRATRKFQNYKVNLQNKVLKHNLEREILFIDEVPWKEVSKFYRSLDLLVAPQRHEGFGLTPLEAMASGVPVIAFRNVGAFNEQILDGVTGIILKDKNPEKLATKINELISNPKSMKDYANQARRHVIKNFQINSEAKNLVGIYENLLNK